ncbi:MAG: flagellar basal body P-ring formation protein FlgA [Acetobacteraceae bacterium]|nr:flagellar basal body P-ring formation protein FlgA [Acetobacteraceae bacterium]
MKFCHWILVFLAIAPADAATLRTVVSLQGPQVHLRDLFDDAGINAARVLGPGPGPGGRIVVEARQLKSIAKQYGVDWEPVSGADRAILEWPGRPLKREDALLAVRAALVAQGAAPDCEIEIPGFAPPLIPVSGTSPPAVTRMDYDQDMGRFTAVLSVTAEGMEPIAVRISGQVSDVIELPVAVVRLPAGAIPGPGDVRMARVHVASVRTEVARNAAMVIGMQLKRQIAAGTPIAVADLMPPTQVARGDPVQLRLQVGGLSLSGQGVALESGAKGERIRVRNISSQAVIEAEVLGPGVVRVVPGTTPITAQARQGISSRRGG